MSEENGVWRTVSGRRVFIKEGQSLTDAMKESGKFESENDEKKVGHYSEEDMAKAIGWEIDSTEKDDEYGTYGEYQKEQFKEQIGVIIDFTEFEYSDIRERFQETGEDYISDEFINKYPQLHWNSGDLYRGVNLDDEVLKSLEVGTIVNQNGLSSWTSEKSIAIEFAESRGENKKGSNVIFIEKSTKNKNAISIAEISRHSSEKEVIYSAYQNFKIKDIYSENGMKYVELEEVS